MINSNSTKQFWYILISSILSVCLISFDISGSGQYTCIVGLSFFLKNDDILIYPFEIGISVLLSPLSKLNLLRNFVLFLLLHKIILININ